ncbi:MAG: nitrilase-related carbon-nitrogen hydrolase [Candidatus Zixiibacteriota bacterium]
MKLQIIQKNINDTDYQKYLQKAANNSVDMVCLGELSTSGCLYNGGDVDDLDKIVKVLSGYNFSIFLGFPLHKKGRLYNAYIYYKNGHYKIYRKINLFEPMNEPKIYQPGKEPGIIETEFGIFGVAICYDLRFPELFKELKQQGAEKIIVPAAFPRVRISDWRELLVRRAKENRVPVIGINAVGNDGVNEFGGSSMAVDSNGKIIVQADEINEGIIEVDL